MEHRRRWRRKRELDPGEYEFQAQELARHQIVLSASNAFTAGRSQVQVEGHPGIPEKDCGAHFPEPGTFKD